MTVLRWQIEKMSGRRALRDEVLRYGELGPDEMRGGWRFLMRQSAAAAERWGLPRRRVSDWAAVFSGPTAGRASR